MAADLIAESYIVMKAESTNENNLTLQVKMMMLNSSLRCTTSRPNYAIVDQLGCCQAQRIGDHRKASGMRPPGYLDDTAIHADLARMGYKVAHVAFEDPHIAPIQSLIDGELVEWLKFIKKGRKELEILQYLDSENNHTLFEVVKFMHDNNVVLIDIKPSNLLIPSEYPYVIDFGVSAAPVERALSEQMGKLWKSSATSVAPLLPATGYWL
ncbi:hypothetical protein CPB84DRAFT_1850743 [Gymnopilus junonius]|uniref:Protein kinase domain-containing protein n=1 Tax=Gymnopilus junonius TaxID=109634 RepID=A0A9P5TJZ7_GYMJU|nr:hypothetical protein CPB84DRAFT_1850743 [Gymnopilus junonius]